MVRTKDGDGIQSFLIINEVKKRPCLFDTNNPNFGDRAVKSRCWDEVCASVVPGWSELSLAEKSTGGKEVQKRWRSIRDSYTKAYRQGKCVLPSQCPAGSRRHHFHTQMAFLLQALQNKKPRYYPERFESFSEPSNSPQHSPPEDIIPRIKQEPIERPLDKPLDLKTKHTDMQDKCQQTIDNEVLNPQLEIKIDANSILPDDHFDDDKLFMNSLLPLFKKMDDDTRLLCRIEVLKIIRYALKGHKTFEALRIAEDNFFTKRLSGMLAKQVSTPTVTPSSGHRTESTLSMTTRSADGSRPIRKRKLRSPSPLPVPPKRRGPGRPRKARPPPSDSESEPRETRERVPLPTDIGDITATSVAQLSAHMFMKMYNLGPSKPADVSTQPPNLQVAIKTEPIDEPSTS